MNEKSNFFVKTVSCFWRFQILRGKLGSKIPTRVHVLFLRNLAVSQVSLSTKTKSVKNSAAQNYTEGRRENM